MFPEKTKKISNSDLYVMLALYHNRMQRIPLLSHAIEFTEWCSLVAGKYGCIQTVKYILNNAKYEMVFQSSEWFCTSRNNIDRRSLLFSR